MSLPKEAEFVVNIELLTELLKLFFYSNDKITSYLIVCETWRKQNCPAVKYQ